MDLILIGNIILIICLVILGVSLYYLIEKVSRTLISEEDRCEVEHAAKKDRRCKGPGMHFIFSKQSKSHKKRGKVRSGKQSVTHSFVR